MKKLMLRVHGWVNVLPLRNHLLKLLRTVQYIFFIALFSILTSCATNAGLVDHQFSFDGWFDKWAETVDLLEYKYGDKYSLVRRSVSESQTTLGYRAAIRGVMPVGEFLYVKWRIKGTDEIIEDRVILKDILPLNMVDHGVTFVIEGRQLYVYLITPIPKHENEPPLLKTALSRFNLTYEIYPRNTYKR